MPEDMPTGLEEWPHLPECASRTLLSPSAAEAGWMCLEPLADHSPKAKGKTNRGFWESLMASLLPNLDPPVFCPLATV